MNIGRYLERSWRLMIDNPVELWIAPLVGSLIAGFCWPFLYGPMMAGIAFLVFRAIRGEKADFADIFRGFDRFGDNVLAALFSGILIAIGFVLCIIPGIIASIGLLYTFQILADTNLSWSQAMTRSWEMIRNRFWEHFVFALVLVLINAVGGLFCGIGTLLTGPLTILAVTVAYEDLTRPVSQ